MYLPIAKKEFEAIENLGFFKLIQSSSNGGYVDLINKENREVSKHLFKFCYIHTNEGIIFTGFNPVFLIPEVREYEKLSIASLKLMIWVAKEFNLPKLFVQSSDSRILESYYETGFNKISISNLTTTDKLFGATKLFNNNTEGAA